METIGAYLRRERELRKIPLDDIARSTKIHLKTLRALENDEIQSLPGTVFIKGFIQSYARTIGLNESEALLHFEEKDSNDSQKALWLKPKRWRIRPWFLFVLFLAVVLLSAFLSSR